MPKPTGFDSRWDCVGRRLRCGRPVELDRHDARWLYDVIDGQRDDIRNLLEQRRSLLQQLKESQLKLGEWRGAK